MKLSEAETIQDQLTVLSKRRWFKTHEAAPDVRENCPPEKIAQADDLVLASFWDTTAQARRTFQILTRQTMKVAAEYVKKQPTDPPDEATRVAWSRLSTQHISDVDSVEADALQEIGCVPVLDEAQPFDAEQGYADAHLVWLWLPREWQEDVPHPLAEIVAWWQNRPTQIERDTKDYGIVPQPFAMVRDLRSEQGPLFEDLPATTGLHTDTRPDLFAALPALGNPLSSHGIVPPSFPLVLYEAAGGQANRPRKGTPLALRLWVEAILSVKIDDRNQSARLIVELRDLISALWPNGWNGPARDAPRLEQAFNQIGRMFVPWEKGRWLAVVVRNRPHYSDMKSPVVFDVELPTGSDRGAMVYRPMIRKYGVKNAAAFRLSLSIPGLWNDRLTYPGRQRKDGQRGGRRILPVVPEVRRNKAGVVLGVDGRPLTDTRGKPVTHWSDPRADRTGNEHRNPELAKRLPWLTPDDLLKAGAAYADRQTPEARRKALERTRKAVRIMVANHDLLLIENGCLWRLEPPDWWGNPDGPRRKS